MEFKITLGKNFVLTVCSAALLLAVLLCVLVYNRKTLAWYSEEEEKNEYVGAESGATNNAGSAQSSLRITKLSSSELKRTNSSAYFNVTTFSNVYDRDGKIIVNVRRGDNGEYIGADYCEYDENGELSVVRMYDSEGNLKSKSVFVLRDDNDKNEENGNSSEAKKVQITYEPLFDSGDRYSGYNAYEYGGESYATVLRKNVYRSSGLLKYYEDYIYGADGLVERTERYTDGQLTRYTDYKYDEDGNGTEIIQTEPDGTVIARDMFEYDGSGRIVLEEHYKDGIKYSYSEYRYDSNGKVEKHTYELADEHSLKYEEIKE